MTGPALVLQYIIIAGYGSLLIMLGYYILRRRSKLSRILPALILFLAMAGFAVYVYLSFANTEAATVKTFLGDYKLLTLDRIKCEHCKVHLKEDFMYDIIVENEIVGHGKWEIGSAIDISGPFLKLENGPATVILEHERVIEFIDRPGIQ